MILLKNKEGVLMKKLRGFLITILCVCAIFVLTGCVNKTALTADEFKTKAETNGYIVSDATSQTEGNAYVKSVYLAISEDMTYQIEFWELADVDSAQSFYNNNQTIFESSKGSGSMETTINLGNNDKYTLSTNDKYKVISRIDNTAVYVNVDEQYKDEVKDFLEELGY